VLLHITHGCAHALAYHITHHRQHQWINNFNSFTWW